MADPTRRLAENVPGEFFVDSTCIDCDTCRQLAPAVFAEGAEYAYVHQQPQSEADRRYALQALLSCPTGSIGSQGENQAKLVLDDFPLVIEAPVYYCGFTSPRSFGGSSYFVVHPDGNWLIDAPKYQPRLVRKLEAMGGIDHIFLTHEDDVADAAKYAAHFGAKRIIHREELSAQPDAETVLDGVEPQTLARDFVAIPTPGHTVGHLVLLFRNRFLFTGDHLYFNRDQQQLSAFRSHCWYSWNEQAKSMSRLLAYRFAWILPGHGQRVCLNKEQMHEQLVALIERMRRDGA
jgi:glyoxylase-like metal-dependent hydrolase (beta-lactamase superfamily II)/ferredoxin